MENIEGNKLIAEFMNLKPMEWDFDGTPMKIWIDKDTEITVYDEPELWYHSSWEWLMNVVEKIGDIDNQSDYEFYLTKNRVNQRAELEIFKTSILCHKEEVYNRVIQFIQWYKQSLGSI